MTPEEFIERWGVNRGELCQLLGRSRSSIDHWISDGNTPGEVLRRLDEIHCRFLQWQIEDENIPELRQLYELIQDRKRLS